MHSLWVQSSQAKRSKEKIFNFTEGVPGVLRGEKVRGDDHGDGEVGTKLVVGVSLSGTKAVLVYANAMDVASLLPLSLVG